MAAIGLLIFIFGFLIILSFIVPFIGIPLLLFMVIASAIAIPISRTQIKEKKWAKQRALSILKKGKINDTKEVEKINVILLRDIKNPEIKDLWDRIRKVQFSQK